MTTTDLETYGWLTAMLMFFIPPIFLFLIIRGMSPEMEWKRATAFYLGWIPGNCIACWYLHYSIGFFSALMILVLTQVIQLAFVFFMGKWLIGMFGENSFR
jgi:hypothetical protein